MLLSPGQLEDILALKDDEQIKEDVRKELTYQYYSFHPRVDIPEDFEEQTAFIEADPSVVKFAVALGGTGSGKTIAAAAKTVDFLAYNKPPRPRCPFWVIGETYDLACGVCWNEKLFNMIPKSWVIHTAWIDRARNWPAAVLLKDDPLSAHPEIGWILEFKSYAQGRERMQAASIGGYWFNEEAPFSIIEEVQGRCRDYDSPGWADFTPVDIRSPEWQEAYENPPEGWQFFHLNTERNSYINQEWIRRYLARLPEDVRETRRVGAFSSFRGQVFKEWNKKIHVIEPFEIPHDWHRIRGLDFGFNNPFVCLWCAKDHDGRYYVYDEHYQSGQLNAYHVKKIKEREWNDNSPYYGQTYSDHDAQERAELMNLGIHCTPARKNVLLGIEQLRSLLMVQADERPMLYVFKQCENLIREFGSYKWPEGTDRKNPKELPLPVNDHCLDALRYVTHSDAIRLSGPPTAMKRVWQPKESLRFKRSVRERVAFNGNGKNGNGRKD